jgi:hypothetical protein
METIIVSAGIAFVLSGLIGGKVEAFGMKIPTIKNKIIRISICILGIIGITYVSYGKIVDKFNEKLLQENINIHKHYSLGFNNVDISNPETNDIYWVKIDNIQKYASGLWSMAYLSKPGPGFIVFNTKQNKLIGLWKDSTNMSRVLPGLIELEIKKIKESRVIASGWWTYDNIKTKYYCYLKEEE